MNCKDAVLAECGKVVGKFHRPKDCSSTRQKYEIKKPAVGEMLSKSNATNKTKTCVLPSIESKSQLRSTCLHVLRSPSGSSKRYQVKDAPKQRKSVPDYESPDFISELDKYWRISLTKRLEEKRARDKEERVQMSEGGKFEDMSFASKHVPSLDHYDFVALLTTGAQRNGMSVALAEPEKLCDLSVESGADTNAWDCTATNFAVSKSLRPNVVEERTGSNFDAHIKLSDHVLFPDISPKTTNATFPNGDGHSIVKNRKIMKRIEEHDMFFSGLKRYGNRRKRAGKSPVAKSIERCINDYETSKKPKPKAKKNNPYQVFVDFIIDSKTRIRDVYSVLDMDNDGVLTYEEMRDGLGLLKLHFTLDEVKEICSKIDENGDESISTHELKIFVSKFDKRRQQEKGKRGRVGDNRISLL